MKNFVANEHHRAHALKRGGSAAVLSLEVEAAEGRFQHEVPGGETPEKLFDRLWAITLLARVMDRLHAELTRAGKEQQFGQLKRYLTGEVPAPSYAQAGVALGISEGAVKVAVHRLRRQFRDLLWDEIAQTVSAPEEVDDEIRHLWAAAAR